MVPAPEAAVLTAEPQPDACQGAHDALARAAVLGEMNVQLFSQFIGVGFRSAPTAWP